MKWKAIAISLLYLSFQFSDTLFYLPVKCQNRQNVKCIHLTDIGQFGLRRKERPNVPSHLHTGIDIIRPNDNYTNEPVFAASEGIVISIRSDGPYAQIIIEHSINTNKKIWTVYEHVAGISVHCGDLTDPLIPIARFMNREELDRYGWKFNHLHFEIMKKAPVKMKPDKTHPQRFFSTYGLVCYNENLLMKNYFDPLNFFRNL